MKKTNVPGIFRNWALATLLLVTLTYCSDEEVLTENSGDDMSTSAMSEPSEITSISVTGLYTELVGDVDCATCTYVVDASEKTIDGKALGLRPGSVVCLKKSVKYSSVDFVNMEGSEAESIRIGYCNN